MGRVSRGKEGPGAAGFGISPFPAAAVDGTRAPLPAQLPELDGAGEESGDEL